MNRLENIRNYLQPQLEHGSPGLEIAPWHSPVVSKQSYPNVLTVDIFSRDELVARARQATPPIDEALIAGIEPVDFVGNAACLSEVIPAKLRGTFAFIVSSHNFEHLPNPIRFLRDCHTLLADNGVLVMAIPDKRCCFDHWRPVSTAGQMIEAWTAKRESPSFAQRIDHVSGRAYVQKQGARQTVFEINTVEGEIFSDTSNFADIAWQIDEERNSFSAKDKNYIDAHCWTFIPESFALLMHDLAALRVIELYPAEITPPQGAEFFVRLTKSALPLPERTTLCRSMLLALADTRMARSDDPRRYRRIFAAYMAALRFLDRLLGKR